MNQNIIFDARVVAKPRVNKVGERVLVNVRVADNPIGQKNKDKYKTRFIDCCFSGFDVERAQKLDTGDVVTVVGELYHREYTKKAEGKKKKGEPGVAYEIPFAQLRMTVKGGDHAAAASEDDSDDGSDDGDDAFDGELDDPLAVDDE